jgi:pimeloyl-ACP methyl ester carboxylesterase
MDGDASAARFIDAEGVRVHVAQRGAGEDLLLIHGASSDMGVFQPTVVPLLRNRFRVTAYDRPGMGFTTERPPRAETLEVQAKVAAGVIDRLGLNRPIVVGHSYGGSVALRLALDHPGKLGGLVLIAAVAFDWPGGVSWHLHWSSNPVVGSLFNQVLTRPFIDTAVRSGTLSAFAPSALPADYLVRAGVMRAARPSAMRANSHDVTALKREIIAQQARYPEITVPVGVITGDSDTVVSPMIHSVKLAQTLPKARIDVLQGVGHLPHEASPERFAKLVDWVQSEK